MPVSSENGSDIDEPSLLWTKNLFTNNILENLYVDEDSIVQAVFYECYLVTAHTNGFLCIWNYQDDCKLEFATKIHKDSITVLANGNNNDIISGSIDETISVVLISSVKSQAEFSDSEGQVNLAAVHQVMNIGESITDLIIDKRSNSVLVASGMFHICQLKYDQESSLYS